jgi:4,5-dihydroxyphthalate decarboxylase
MDIPSTGPVRLRTNLSDTPLTLPLKQGQLSSPLVDFDFCGPPTAHDGFKDMVANSRYDAGELAIATFLQARAYHKPYVLLPVRISGRLQHHGCGYNSAFGELKPKDIEGRRVGVRSYSQTTPTWFRGILQHEYGVDLDKVTWCTLNDGHLAEYRDPPNCERLPKGSNLGEMMLSGKLDAAILGSFVPDDPRVRSLVPDPRNAARAWYARVGVLPINHMFVVHQELARKRPDVVREIYRLFVESEQRTPDGSLSPPLGYEANRKGLEMAIEWCFEQKIIPRRLQVDALFDETTAALN